jgi:hypothetical protein
MVARLSTSDCVRGFLATGPRAILRAAQVGRPFFVRPAGRTRGLRGAAVPATHLQKRYLTVESPSAHENSRSSSFGGDALR